MPDASLTAPEVCPEVIGGMEVSGNKLDQIPTKPALGEKDVIVLTRGQVDETLREIEEDEEDVDSYGDPINPS
ncbi:MAG: hypothetical protein WC846_00770 [Candidatus Gracilibacteria bacterium]|jgi:hypothetical protein